jgi:carbon monoxide dehydrogenase subunit G
MIIEGKFSVKAPIQKLWDTLFGDVKGVAACMPGVENLDVVNDKAFNLTMKQKVGIFNVTMKGPLLLTTVQAPTHLDLAGEFADITKLGQIKAKIILDLAEKAPDVELSYKLDVAISGKMSALGVADRFMRTKGAQIEKEFIANLKGFIAKKV